MALLGLGFAAGICLIVLGIRPRPVPVKRRGWRRRRATLPAITPRVLAAGTATLVVAVVTRWPVAAVAAGVGVWVLWGTRPAASQRRYLEVTDALALWVGMLRDTASTAAGTEQALIAAVRVAPEAIRPEAERLARRLQRHPLERALPEFADELAHPIADLVAVALTQSTVTTSEEGDLSAVLGDLARAARDDAEMRRRVAVARQRPRSQMRLVAGFTVGFAVLLVVVGRDFLAPYSTATGQVVLAGIVAWGALSGWWMSRMAHIATVERFLTRRGPRP